MNTHESRFHCGSGNVAFHTSPFSAFQILRNYNYLLPSDAAEISSKQLLNASRLLSDYPIQPSNSEQILPFLRTETEPGSLLTVHQKPFGCWQKGSILQTDLTNTRSNLISPCGTAYSNNIRRQRGEKKPIPDEQKDDKYFERRKRNNQAAKKSRDARKLREDHVALKATILEHENAILRAQVLTLRDEAAMLRQLLMNKKVSEF